MCFTFGETLTHQTIKQTIKIKKKKVSQRYIHKSLEKGVAHRKHTIDIY